MLDTLVKIFGFYQRGFIISSSNLLGDFTFNLQRYTKNYCNCCKTSTI